jgi:class 3 adenylate cyclase
MSIFSKFLKRRSPLSRETGANSQVSHGSLCTLDSLWRTGDLRVRQHGEKFDISLEDESLANAFRAKFPGAGETISGERALIIAHVFAALDGALEAWRLAEPTAWPESASRELRALPRICSRLGGNTSPIGFFCDPQRIRNIAASFVDVLRNHPGIRPNFGSGLFTVYNVTIQFGNILGCGGAVGAAANFYG